MNAEKMTGKREGKQVKKGVRTGNVCHLTSPIQPRPSGKNKQKRHRNTG